MSAKSKKAQRMEKKEKLKRIEEQINFNRAMAALRESGFDAVMECLKDNWRFQSVRRLLIGLRRFESRVVSDLMGADVSKGDMRNLVSENVAAWSQTIDHMIGILEDQRDLVWNKFEKIDGVSKKGG